MTQINFNKKIISFKMAASAGHALVYTINPINPAVAKRHEL